MKQPAVYILSNKRNGTLYVGVTSDLIHRVYQHKNNMVEGFSKKYQTHVLVYFEQHLIFPPILTPREPSSNSEKRASERILQNLISLYESNPESCKKILVYTRGAFRRF
ncbi:MAG: GIY-YIG nuclease family protein [Marinicella sp.]